MARKRKILIVSILICFFIGSCIAMWEVAKVDLPESERCDGGNSCAMKYADTLKEMKENK